jgi:hypothetical protein
VQDVKVFQFVSQKTLASANAKTAESFKSVQCDLELLEAEASRLQGILKDWLNPSMENTITSQVSEIVRIKRKDLCTFFDCI